MARMLLVVALMLVAVKANEEANLLSAIVEGIPTLGKYVRPVSKASDALTVDVSLTPVRIISFSAKGDDSGYGSLTVAGWIGMSWTDANIDWNPEDHDGIAKLTISADIVKNKIWLPDIVSFDGAPWSDKLQEVDIVATSSGLIYFIRPAILDYVCSPSDGGNGTSCVANYGSWTQDGGLVDIGQNPTVDMEYFFQDPNWTVTATAERREKKYDCCPEIYPSVRVTLNLDSREESLEHRGD